MPRRAIQTYKRNHAQQQQLQRSSSDEKKNFYSRTLVCAKKKCLYIFFPHSNSEGRRKKTHKTELKREKKMKKKFVYITGRMYTQCERERERTNIHMKFYVNEIFKEEEVEKHKKCSLRGGDSTQGKKIFRFLLSLLALLARMLH